MNCPNCGMNLPDDGRVKVCYFCGHNFSEEIGSSNERNSTKDHDTMSRASERFYCPWEDQENVGMFSGLYATLRASMFLPATFFLAMPRKGGYIYPLLYAMIVSTLGAMGSMVWGFIFKSPIFAGDTISPESAIIIGVSLPLMIPVGVLVSSAVLHLCLKIVKASKTDFQTTFRVVCYSSGPDLINVFVPVIGSAIAFVWQLVISVIGLSITNGTSIGRVILAYIALFFLGVLIGLAILALAIGAAALI